MASEGDAERLVVLLEARIKDFEKNMAKASGTATKGYAGMRQGSRTATGAMEADMVRSTNSINRSLAMTSTRMGGLARSGLAGMTGAFIAGLAPILSVAAALNTAKAALDDFDKIAKNAKASGIDGEAFQEFAYAAELGGVATDEFAKALETFNKNAGLATVGKGKMITALKVLNPELLTNILATQDQAERLKLAADAIDKAGSASEKAALATTLFGEAGTRMVEVLKGGRAALDQTAKAARDLGLVIGNDLLARAETLNDEFGTATRVMDLEFKRALIDLAPILIATAQLAGNLASAINYMVQSMQSLENRSTARLEEDYKSLMATLDSANADRPNVVGTMGIEIDPGKQAEMQAEADAMRAELKRRAMQQLAAELNKPKLVPFEAADIGGTRAAAADAAIKQAEAVKALIANLQHEQDQLGRTAAEQELYNALKSVGVTADSEFGQAIAATMGPLQEQRNAIEANAEMMSLLGDMGKSAVNGIIDAMEDGKVTTEEWGSILSDVLGMAGQFFLNAAFSGLGGGGGGFNLASLFQRRETGGPVQAGVPYIVGEKRPELFVPDQAGTIVPKVPAGGSQGSAESRVFAPVFNINGTGLDEHQVSAAIYDALDRYDRHQAPVTFQRIQNDPLARG